MKKWLMFLPLFLLACAKEKNSIPMTKDPNPTLTVETALVTSGSLIETLRTSGIVEGKQEIYVVSETEGVLQQVSFELGDFVEKGVPLAMVDSQIPELNYLQTISLVESAKVEYNAVSQQYKQGSSSLADYKNSLSRLRGQEANKARALKALKDTTLRAPISGEIAMKPQNLTVGNYLSRGSQIARIVDLKSLKTSVFLGEMEILMISKESPVRIKLHGKGEWTSAKIAAIASGSNPQTGSFQVIVTWPNTWEGIVKAGMIVDVEITTINEGSLVFPSQAMTERLGKKGVYLVKDGVARFQALPHYNRLAGKVSVMEYLKPGDQVILNPPQNLPEEIPLTFRLVNAGSKL